MLKKERQELIIHEVNLHNKVLVADLSTKISVSEDTVRRDLIELSDEGRLVKVHGGAISNSFRNSYKHTDIYSLDQKKVIAQKAVSIIEDGMLVFTTGGTTLLEMLRILPQSLRATFVTVSVPGAFELLQHPQVEVIIIGGKLSRNAQIVVGGEAIHRIRKFNADLAFLGVNAIDKQRGITDNDYEVTLVKQAIIESSSHVAALTISEKLNTVQKIQVCPPGGYHSLVTELPPDHALLHPYQQSSTTIL